MKVLYRICKSRHEAEGLTKAIAKELSFLNTKLSRDEKGRIKSLLIGGLLRPNLDSPALRADLEVIIRESKAEGMYQMTILATDHAMVAHAKKALHRRQGKRIQWPVKT
jgi:hypothetical protein